MKIGDRVRLMPGVDSIWQRRYGVNGVFRGMIIRFRADGRADVMWDHGWITAYHPSYLILEESFPYRSHRTMAQVMEDEQKPVS